MFGYLIPETTWKTCNLASKTQNIIWYDAIKLEIESMQAYKVFKKRTKEWSQLFIVNWCSLKYMFIDQQIMNW